MMNKEKPSKAWSWKVATFLPLLALLLMAFGRQSENAMDFKETQNSVSQKSEEKQSVQNGISRDQLDEYENIVNKVVDSNGVPELRKISDTDKKRLETLYLSMNAEQRAAQIVIFIPAPPPLPKSVPTVEQMKTWEDSKTYGLWINGKRVNNSELKNYTNTDFATVVFSKLAKNAVNYEKHYYQVDLLTNEYYADYLARRELAEKYGIATRKKKEDTKSKSANDIEGKANLKAFDFIQPKLYVVDGVITDQRRAKYFMEVGVESVTILNGKDATDKYGEKAKNGVFEITLKKGNVIKSDYPPKNGLMHSSTQAINSDSIKESETNKFYYNESIEFQADKMVLDSAKRSILYLYKNVKINFQDIKLSADYVELNRDSFLVYAAGKADSTGAITGKPTLTIGKDEVNAEGIRYNLKTRRGVTYGITTTR